MKKEKMAKNITNLDVDYGNAIDIWIKKCKAYKDKIDFKELARLSNKEIVNKMTELRKDPYGRIIIGRTDISGRALVPPMAETPVIDLTSYYDSPDRYYEDLFYLISRMRGEILGKIYKESYIQFRYTNEYKIYKMSSIHFIYNMITWFPFFILGIDISKENTFMPREFNNKTYVDFVNNKIIIPYKHLVTHNQMSKMLAKMYDLFIVIAEQYGLDLGLSFSVYDLIKKWDNKEIYDINHVKVPRDMQISDAEKMLNKKLNRYMELMRNDPNDNVLKPLLRSGQGVNSKQLREFCLSFGFKPNFSGETYNIKPNANFITEGLRTPTDYVIDATGGRKAAILSLQIDEAGYLERSFTKATYDIYLNPDPDYDCGSVNYYEKTIRSEEDLSDMHGRWYVTSYNTLRQLDEHDTHLIGETLQFRSPATCASKNGICATCYGYMYQQNVHINAGVNSSIKLAERQYQNTMSAKHILNTKTDRLEFNSEFYDFFDVKEGYIIALSDAVDDDFYDRYDIRININDVYREQNIEDQMNNEYLNRFSIYDKETGDVIEMVESNDNSIYITGTLFKIFCYKRSRRNDDEDEIAIPMSDLPFDENLFFAQLRNAELTKPLKEIRKMIEQGKEIDEVSSISSLIDRLNELMKSGGIYTESVHIEILARNLIRSASNPTELPDYTVKNPDYIITSIHNSIYNSNSIITSLTFEKIKDRFSDPLSYYKTAVSPLDKLFLLE